VPEREGESQRTEELRRSSLSAEGRHRREFVLNRHMELPRFDGVMQLAIQATAAVENVRILPDE
jgi:hypothetical protein